MGPSPRSTYDLEARRHIVRNLCTHAFYKSVFNILCNTFVLYFLNNPHNKREKARNSTIIVEMKGESTYLRNPDEPDEEPKKFTFDFSYWSHDGFEENADGYLGKANPNYADQVL